MRLFDSNKEANEGTISFWVIFGFKPSSLFLRAPMCFGVVPQHPPSIATPSMELNSNCSFANSS